MSNLTLFLNIKGKEVKKVLELDDFEAPIEYELISSINGKQQLLNANKINTNSFRDKNPVIDNDEFVAGLNQLYADQANQEAEVKLQAEIQQEFEAAQKIEDQKALEKGAKLKAEEAQRLQDMKKEVETRKIQKQSTVSTKKSTK